LEETTKLLSVIVEGGNRAARLMGEGVLDVTAFCEIWNRKVNASSRTEI
jgi:hypothetical protein